MPVNIASWIERNAAVYRDKLALKDERHRLSYNDLQRRCVRIAGGLRALGVTHGERVALLLPNCAEMVETLFSCARLGAIYVPLNWRLGEEELAFIISDCTPRVLIYSSAWRERAKRLKEQTGLPLVLVEMVEVSEDNANADADAPQDYESLCASDDATHEALTGGADDPLMLIYTSGTTGNPKGVMLTHTNVFWHTINGWALGLSPDNVCLVLLPLFHVGGLNGSATPVLHIGGTVLLQRTFEAGVVLQTIAQERVTGVLGVPTIYRILADHPDFETTDLSHCEVLLSGGAPLPEALIHRYHERGLEFRQGYGLTEASPGVTGMGPGECLKKAGSAGRGLLYTEVRIVDADGNALPPGESGEITVRGANVMKGYWNRPEETANALRNGWLYTGDIGRFDEDGFLYIVDRKKDMIISGGENIYPAEIEKLLAGHPDVQLATVIGRSDDKWGEVPVAVIVRQPHAPELSRDVLHDYLQKRLARYKLPKDYFFLESLPLNAAGKVVKSEVKQLLGLG